MKPIQLKHMKRTNVWNPARRVWFQKNEDEYDEEPYSREEQKQIDIFRERTEEQMKKAKYGQSRWNEAVRKRSLK